VIPRNVAKLVKVTTPKYTVNRGLSLARARQVLRAAKTERLYALYVLALCLGPRRGELLGLRWEDIDLDAGTLEVVQALQRVGGALRFVRPKTEDSACTIPLPPLCIDALREHRRQQFTERADAWSNWQENGLVFPTRIGTPMEPDNLRRSWGRIRVTAGLTGTRFHDMRHTCVSLWLHLGVAPDMVRDIVGHSDIEVTITIYAHTALDENARHSPSWATRSRSPRSY
jgi:integrase